MSVPEYWYNILADLDFELPPDLPARSREGSSIRPQVPLALVRQEMSRERRVAIPAGVIERYRQWRPTPLRRARAFEDWLGTRCPIFYKYEGGNLSGSHKLNTAVAQAYYYRRAGVRRLTVGTGAGQWGTAVAAACSMFGLDCTVYMVRSSLLAKPYRKTIMEMLGATVVPSPSGHTDPGRRAGGDTNPGSLAVALAEAFADAQEPETRFCTGSGETYALLHQTVIGLEAREQLAEVGCSADVVIGAIGGGSNFGGLALPFLEFVVRDDDRVRCVSVEPAACPKLTRGTYAYDFTDASGLTPLQKMYTLGHRFVPPEVHAGGLRYHATAKLISALYDRKLIYALACGQREVFATSLAFAKSEGILPAPESAYAIHGATIEARRAERSGSRPVILVGVSGHGLLDMAAYESYMDGTMVDAEATDHQIEAALAHLPGQPVLGRVT